MIAYKLCRELRDGSISSLFINRSTPLKFNEWMEAENHPTKGFAVRPHWHCTSSPIAPHLKKEGRVWVTVEIEDFTEFSRPKSQGGVWYLANKIRIIEKTPTNVLNEFEI